MRRRRVGFIFICSAIVPLTVAAAAWACGVLATLKANVPNATPNQVVTVKGVNYSSAVPGTFNPVNVRWDTRDGQILATVTPDAGGTISTPVTIPGNASAGSHLLLATQTRVSDGTPKNGTPGRTSIRITGAGSRASSAPASPWAGTSGPTDGPGGSVATVKVDGAGSGSPALFPTLLGIMLSLGLMGTGLVLVRGKGGSANRPLPGV